MRADRPSETASYVAMGRALAHARRDVQGFDDPMALGLLTDDFREAVERRIRREWPRRGREAWLGVVATAVSRLMGPRTVDIDEGLREMKPGFQVVIVGAGLDARAHRMRELSSSIVFEVDHPASQALKRQRAAGLTVLSTEVRYVPIDFARESLDDALEHAGHAVSIPTAWVFEGVISYLTPREVEASIAIMASRSAAGSRLLATYNEPHFVRRVFALVTARAAEPQRAWFSRSEMKGLLARNRFSVRSDRDGQERRRRYGKSNAGREADWVRFHHVVIADFAPAPPGVAGRAS